MLMPLSKSYKFNLKSVSEGFKQGFCFTLQASLRIGTRG
jgi:hypothetical protein